jgi:hypothetical protein
MSIYYDEYRNVLNNNLRRELLSGGWIHGRDSSAGIATNYRLDGPGSIFRYFQFFHTFSFLMYYLLPYVLMFLHSVHSALMLRILYSLLHMYYCLRIVHCLCNTATGHRPNCGW